MIFANERKRIKKENKKIVCERFDSDETWLLKILYVSSIEDNPTLLINAVSKSLSFRTYLLPLTMSHVVGVLKA